MKNKDTDYVETSVGRIQGHLVSAPGSEDQLWEYLGIPFAKPPIGELRFSDPEPLDKLPQGKEIYSSFSSTDENSLQNFNHYY